MEFGGAEEALLRQLCTLCAFPVSSEGGVSLLPAYLSGERRLLLENFPELGFFRDVRATAAHSLSARACVLRGGNPPHLSRARGHI